MFQVTPTTERIDMERLKRRDAIAFSSSVILFEDELADHGIAQLSARCRVMREGYFFVLLRFYMRVDGVLLRCCDTRIVGDDNSGKVIREWQLREANTRIFVTWTQKPCSTSTGHGCICRLLRSKLILFYCQELHFLLLFPLYYIVISIPFFFLNFHVIYELLLLICCLETSENLKKNQMLKI
ncbi:Protein CBG12269 [Caenorhabditis briggsae]|uniref:TIP41-like protein n=1 Tax=Caenorhabditis briggsae TaxID=6238 RepID=A8XF50_CAEBR|nr:Protein CBG12269 [Caenorhabditis briggsae]CAP31272.1 Protein CBG12269 [Caenorhabditis briggsae]